MYICDKKKKRLKIMEKETRGAGRHMDEAKKALVLDCIQKGLGYQKSVPIFIEHGYVDENGKCTVNQGSFNFLRQKQPTAKIEIFCSRAEKNWAKEHEEEILTYIKTRMAMESGK